MTNYAQKVVLITGAAQGIGQTLALALGREGAIVVVTDIDYTGANRAAAEVIRRGGKAVGLPLDVTQPGQFERVVNLAVAQFGRLDYLFNNAGIAIVGEFQQVTQEEWAQLIDINLWGVIHGTRAGYAVMREQGFGHIVNIASVAGLTPFPTNTSYALTKHGVVGLSNSLRPEARDLGVKVSVVCPGFIDTKIYERSRAKVPHIDQTWAQLAALIITPERAVQEILRGVAQNRAVIVFPVYARLLWRIYHLAPFLLIPFYRRIVRDFRARFSQAS